MPGFVEGGGDTAVIRGELAGESGGMELVQIRNRTGSPGGQSSPCLKFAASQRVLFRRWAPGVQPAPSVFTECSWVTIRNPDQALVCGFTKAPLDSAKEVNSDDQARPPRDSRRHLKKGSGSTGPVLREQDTSPTARLLGHVIDPP
ncbi:hypothetical protein GCM10009548_05600 [Streptomyces malaysiensis subsp. malaysiensis]